MDMEAQKGDGLQAFVVPALQLVMNSLDSSSVLIKMTNVISFKNNSVRCAGKRVFVFVSSAFTVHLDGDDERPQSSSSSSSLSR